MWTVDTDLMEVVSSLGQARPEYFWTLEIPKGVLQGKKWKTGFSANKCFLPLWRFRGFWRDGRERKHILRRNRPRVPNFLSHRIVESLKLLIFDIL